MTKTELLALVDERDALTTKIEAGMTELGLDAKGLKQIRKAIAEAEAAAEAAAKTLAALMGVDPEAAAAVGGTQTEPGE